MDFVSMETVWLGIKINFIRGSSEIKFHMGLVWQSIFYQGYRVTYKKCIQFQAVVADIQYEEILLKIHLHVFLKVITRY